MIGLCVCVYGCVCMSARVLVVCDGQTDLINLWATNMNRRECGVLETRINVVFIIVTATEKGMIMNR